MAQVVSFFADLVLIVAHLFVICVLLFASSLLVGAVCCRVVSWLNSRRLRVDFGPNKSRGWTDRP